MLNEEIIQEELENLGCTALDTTQYLDGILPFIDDTHKFYIKIYLFKENKIGFRVFLITEATHKTILVSENKIPFNDRKCAWTRIENILNKNRQLIKKYEQYQNTLSFIREKDETDAIRNEFISHFSQFGVNKDFGVVVYGYFGKMIISLDNGLHLVVQVDSSDESLISVFSAILNKGNYKRVFDNVDDLIHEFQEKSPDSDTYLGLLKESI